MKRSIPTLFVVCLTLAACRDEPRARDAAAAEERDASPRAPVDCPRSLEFREALPLSAAGNVLKRELRKPFWEGFDRAVA